MDTSYARRGQSDKLRKILEKTISIRWPVDITSGKCVVEAYLQSSPVVSNSWSNNTVLIPYLKACLDESVRLNAPIGFGLPRRMLVEGSIIAGHRIPCGVTISAPVYTIQRNETLFKDASKYVPERSLSENPGTTEENRSLKYYYLPFSLGGWVCIGRNLAYMQMSSRHFCFGAGF